MTGIEMVGAVILIIVAIAVIISVVLQESKGGGLSALGGANESQYDKTRGRTNEATLSMITKFSGIALFVVTLGVLAFSLFA